MFIGWILLVLATPCYVKCDIFPSLLTTNATLAIVIDKEYLAEKFDDIKLKIEDYLVYAKREILKNGGINVAFFSWSAINVQRDLTALISITSCSNTWDLFRAAETENLLHIAISERDCVRLPPENAITIPIIEKGQETPQLLLDLRTTGVYKWKHMIIIYDNTINVDLLTRVIKSITRQANRIGASGISLMNLMNNATSTLDDIRYTLKAKLETINSKTVGGNFLVIVNLELVEVIMEYAKDLKLVDPQNQWLYVISNTDNRLKNLKRFKRMLKEGDNVAFIYNNTIVNEICVGGLICHIEETLAGFTKSLDDAILEEREIASQVSEEEWEAIRPTKLERSKFLLDKVKQYLIDHGTCDNCTKWKLETGETWGREYQMQGETDVAEILSVGTWRPSDGPSMTDALFPHVAHGFRRKSLPLVSFHNPPWQILKLNASGDVVEHGGIVFDVIRELSRNLNFTYTVEIVKPLVDSVGNNVSIEHRHRSNDSVAFMEASQISTYKIPRGIIEMVHNKSVAMGACGLTVTESNRKLVNFTNPISIQSYTFVVARPRELSRALLFISPFRGDTWLCLSATIFSMGPILYCIHKLSPVYEYKGIRGKGGLSTVQNCIWYMYGALLQQGGMHLPYADSARIIVGSWWLVVLVISTTYCGNLVAYLTFPKIEVPIKTLEDMIAHRDTVTWSYARNTFFEHQLKTSDDSTYKLIHRQAKDMWDTRKMIEAIRTGKHVYIDWKMKLQFMIKQQVEETDTCSFALGIDEFSDEQIALIVAPDTPYLIKINEEIKKLHQVGLIQKWLENYLPKKDKCWKKKRSIEVTNHTVNMDDMQGSFFVLFIGFFTSVLIICIEKLWSKQVRNKKEKRALQPFVT